jgi:DNA polymerase III epsilon subunit-like protein
MNSHDFYISVDVETAGPNPGDSALLSIGACTVLEPAREFYVELKPDREKSQPEALAISGLDMDELKQNGQHPKEAMQAFADWVAEVTLSNHRPIFVAFNAPFDWMFVNEYFHRYLGHNPFGHSALDIKAYYMGAQGVAWGETGFEDVTSHYAINHPLTHNALQDALDQAVLFRKMIEKNG